MESGLASRQDCTQFEDALRRLYALELKLTDQVQVDIRELRQKWVLPRVERVTTNTFKLYQVREQLKKSKVLFLEEERILEEFKNVKLSLKEKSMDEEEFDATRETCMLLGGKLMDIRAKQHRTYSDNQDLEVVINRDIMAIRFEDKDFAEMDVEEVRASTPLRKRSPTPLDRLRSREPSPFCMPKLRLGSGTITPGGSKPADPHTFFSRSSSSQSLHQGGGGLSTQLDFDSFRAAMEAKQAEDESLPSKTNTQVYSHSMRNLSFKPPTQPLVKNESNDQLDHPHIKAPTQYITKNESSDHLAADGVFLLERPSSAMSEMSIHIGDHEIPSRAESRMEAAPLGDAISQGHLNIHSNFSSRRGSEFQNFMTKEDKNVSSWLNKNDNDEDRDLKTPVNQTYSSVQAPEQTTTITGNSKICPPANELPVQEIPESKARKQSDHKHSLVMEEEKKKPSLSENKQSNKKDNKGKEDEKLSRPESKIKDGQAESITEKKQASKPGSKPEVEQDKIMNLSAEDADTIQEKTLSRPESRIKEGQAESVTDKKIASRPQSKQEVKQEKPTSPSAEDKKIASRTGKVEQEKTVRLSAEDADTNQGKTWSRPGSKIKEGQAELVTDKKTASRPGSKQEVEQGKTLRPSNEDSDPHQGKRLSRPGSKINEGQAELVTDKKSTSRPGSKQEVEQEKPFRPSTEDSDPDQGKQLSRPGSKEGQTELVANKKSASRPGSKQEVEQEKQLSRPGSKIKEGQAELVTDKKSASRPGSKQDIEHEKALTLSRPGSNMKAEQSSTSEKKLSRPASKQEIEQGKTSRSSMREGEDTIQDNRGERPISKVKEEQNEAFNKEGFVRLETSSPTSKKQLSRPGSNMKEDDEGLFSSASTIRKGVKSPVGKSDQPSTDEQGDTVYTRETLEKEGSDYSRPKSKNSSRPGSRQKETDSKLEPSSYETDSVTKLQALKETQYESLDEKMCTTQSRSGNDKQEAGETYDQEMKSQSRPNSRLRKETKSPVDENQTNISRPGSKLRKKSECERGDIVDDKRMSTPNKPKSRSRNQSENEKEEELKKLKDQFYKERLGNETESKGELQIPESENAPRPVSRNEELRRMAEELVSEEPEQKSDIPKRGRTTSISSAGFEQTEPAEWIQDEDDEDELMIILNTDTYGLGNVKEEAEEEVPETHKVDDRAMEELEMQYQLESGKRSAMSERSASRPMSPHERPPSILKGSRDGSNERKEKDHQSRPVSRSSNKDTSLDRKKISFDDDYQPNFPNMGDDVSHSQERPGSRTSIGSHKSDHNIDRKKSSSLVPELETVEVPRELKEKLDRIESSDVRGRPLERRDSPRPPSRPSSTGYTHLDEFERKLAEMEDDLQTKDDIDLSGSPMQKSKNMWNLVDDEILKENSTYDGYYLNKEAELPTVDHSMIMGGELEEELRSKKVSFASKDEKYEIQRHGEVKTLGKNLYSLSPPKPMRKLPGKEVDPEEYQQTEEEIIPSKEVSVEKETSKGFFRSLSGTFKRSRSHTPDTEKENTSLFGSLLRKGKWGSKSASRQSSVDRESRDIGSDLEGRLSRASDAGSTDSLVMKIKKLGKKKQKKVSTTDFDELFARGRAMSAMNDSEPEIVKSNERTFRNVEEDDIIGFNEKVHAFLEDQAKNSEYIPNKIKKSRSTKSVEKSQSFAEANDRKIKFTSESNLKLENKVMENKKPEETKLIQEPQALRKVSTYSKPEDIKLGPVKLKKDIFTGKDLPQTQDEEFLATITDFVSNYKQKPNYEQIWPASPSRPNRTKCKRQSSEILSRGDSLNLQDTQVNLQNFENKKQQNIKKSSSVDASFTDLTNDAGAASAQEMEFLTKVSSFIDLHADSEDYVQKIWPSTPTESKKKKTMSPGKSYLDHTGESQWFGTSIEADSYEAKKQVTDLDKRKKSKNSLGAGASLMRHHLSATATNKSATVSNSNPASEPMSPSSRSSIRVSNSQPPPELPSSSLQRSGSNQSQISNQEFYTKLVIGLQKYTTPEPESRKDQSSIQFPNQLQKSQSDTHVKDPSAQLKTKSASTTIANKNKASSGDVDKNLEFYDKLVTGLKVMTSNQELAKETDPYKKYSHHLGRAEFGTLKRKESVESSKSKLNYSHSFNKDSRGMSRDSSFDKINPKLKKMSRQDSGERYVRGQSRMSDTSETMPDLELDDEIETEMHRKIHGVSEATTDKKVVSSSTQSIPLPENRQRSDEAIQNIDDQREKIKAIKDKIQNTMMTVVGVGAMAYLSSLEQMGGGS